MAVGRWWMPAALAALGLLGVLAVIGVRWQSTAAIAPCVPHANTSEELQMKTLVEEFRFDEVPGSVPMTLDSDLNEAAYGYAKFVADTPGASGHNADGAGGAYPWVTRATQCGYVSHQGQTYGGEGIAVATNGALTADEALVMMKSQQGSQSGIHTWNASFAPVKCIGVAKAANGTRVVWVVLVFGKTLAQSCNTAPPPPPPTNTPGNTSTPTNTPDATATPTDVPPTATPHFQSIVPGSIREGEE